MNYSQLEIARAIADLAGSCVFAPREDGSYSIVMDDGSTPPTPQQIEARIEEMAAYVPVPGQISDRQFFQQAAILGLITKAEARAAVKTGDVPAAVQIILDELPEDSPERFAADMLLEGATEFRRDHPLVGVFATAFGMTSAQVDDFFRAAALL